MHSKDDPRMVARLASLAAVMLIATASAHAAPITYDFTGTIFSGHGYDVPAGTPFSGSFTYDPELPWYGDYANTPTSATYGYDDRVQPGPAAAFSARIEFGGRVAYTTADPAYRHVRVSDVEVGYPWHPMGPHGDAFHIQIGEPVGSGDTIGTLFTLHLQDTTGAALAGSGLPATLDLSKFNESGVGLTTPDGAISGRLTTLTPQGVPEPSTLTVMGLGALGLLLARRRRARAAASR